MACFAPFQAHGKRFSMKSQLSASILSVLCLTLHFPNAVAGATNYVLSVQSAADYVQVPENSALDLVDQFTLEAWVNVKQFSGSDQTVIAKRRSVAGTMFALRVASGRVVLAMNDNVQNFSVGTNPDLQTNQWHHIAATYDGSIAEVYIDGMLQASTGVSMKLRASSLPLTIGQEALPNDLRNFVGLIDEVRIWAVALTDYEIRSTMSLAITGTELGLRSYWNFDDGSAKDSGSSHCDGILTGNAQIVPSDQPALTEGVLFTGAQLRGGVPLFTVASPAGKTLLIYSSSNLVDWVSVTSIQTQSGVTQFVDPNGGNQRQSFYRAVSK